MKEQLITNIVVYIKISTLLMLWVIHLIFLSVHTGVNDLFISSFVLMWEQ